MNKIKCFVFAIARLIRGEKKSKYPKQLVGYSKDRIILDRIIFSDDLEKYRQVNGSLNDEGSKIFCQRVKDYLDKKEVE